MVPVMPPVKIIDREIFDRLVAFFRRADFHGTANREMIFRSTVNENRHESTASVRRNCTTDVQVHAVIKGALGDGAFFEVARTFSNVFSLSRASFSTRVHSFVEDGDDDL